MSQSIIEFGLLAAIALFIGWRLYITLGQDGGPPEGRERHQTPAEPAAREQKSGEVVPLRPNFTGPAAAGLEAIHEADPSFEPRGFMQGARAAYEMLVTAFARGDRETLKPLLDTDVWEAWDAAISARAEGEEGMQLLRIRNSDIVDASLGDDGMARVMVEFEAELGDGESNTRTQEIWTFMRQTRNSDPNWLLDDVDTVD